MPHFPRLSVIYWSNTNPNTNPLLKFNFFFFTKSGEMLPYSCGKTGSCIVTFPKIFSIKQIKEYCGQLNVMCRQTRPAHLGEYPRWMEHRIINRSKPSLAVSQSAVLCTAGISELLCFLWIEQYWLCRRLPCCDACVRRANVQTP